ncbi:MAG: metallophosphoesterase [Myxococcales bacterium]|nr:metallophosphoesterase [Myxococcales bacterium]
MTRIAHLTDLHLVERRPEARSWQDRLRIQTISQGRPIDSERPRRRLRRAFAEARAARADHVVVTGDLTEDGIPAQFEVLAEELHAAPFAPEQITLVPGNHDGYTSGDAFENALAGPLAAFRVTSRPGTAVELKGATVVALSTTIHQHWLRAAGELGERQRRRIHDVLHARERRGATVLAMHHPPFTFGLRLGWLEGLLDLGFVRTMLRPFRSAHVLCGHVHERGDHRLGPARHARLHTAHSVAEDDRALRLYDAIDDRLVPSDGPVPFALAMRAFRQSALGEA